VFLMQLRQSLVEPAAARASIAAGFVTSSVFYLWERFGAFGAFGSRAELLSLVAGLSASVLALIAHRHMRATTS